MKIYVGQAVGRDVNVQHMQCLMTLMTTRLPASVTYHPANNDALVSRSRSIVATRFLESDADVLLTIDTDIGFNPEHVMTVCQQAMTNDIVGAMYVTRNRARCFPALWAFEGQRMEFGPNAPELYPIKWAATGFLAVHRRVFEKLAKRDDMHLCHEDSMRFYPFYEPYQHEDPEAGWIYLSEDYALCERARQEGFAVYVNPHVRLGHIGTWVYTLEDTLQSPLPEQPLVMERDSKGYHIETLQCESVPAATGLPPEKVTA